MSAYFDELTGLTFALAGTRGALARAFAATPAAEAFVQSLRDRGVNVKVVRADAGSAEDVSRLLAEIRSGDQPLRGVFHLAMVIDDAPLAALNRERLRAVMTPKAYGAWLLHKGTQDFPLDCFVMFSSISSILVQFTGSPMTPPRALR